MSSSFRWICLLRRPENSWWILWKLSFRMSSKICWDYTFTPVTPVWLYTHPIWGEYFRYFTKFIFGAVFASFVRKVSFWLIELRLVYSDREMFELSIDEKKHTQMKHQSLKNCVLQNSYKIAGIIHLPQWCKHDYTFTPTGVNVNSQNRDQRIPCR